MNNKTKTVILLPMITAMLSMAMLPVDVFAHTPAHGGTLPGGNAAFYFDSSLNDLNVNGQTDQLSVVRNQVQSSMETYNDDPSDLNFSTTLSSGGNAYTVRAESLTIFGYSAYASYPNDSVKELVFNTDRDFGTSYGCNPFYWFGLAFELEWLANHELGHVAGLGHAHWNDGSVMRNTCTSYWADIQQQDTTTLESLY